MDQELVVWALRPNETRTWAEVILSENCKNQLDVDRIISAASQDGFHSFRVQIVDLSTPPDFIGTITKGES